MERTQIYLTAAQTRELDRRAKLQGTTRSHLIREAVTGYLGPIQDPVEFKAALAEFAGINAGRDDLDEIYADLSRRSRAKLRRLWPDRKVVLDEDEIEPA
jgi:Ribbon-helix-helix protein, copG family